MIEWSLGAEQQVSEIRWSFQSVTALERFEIALEQAFEQLETFPESARMHPALFRDDVRAILIGDYRMTVLLLEDRILVFSIVHARSGTAFD